MGQLLLRKQICNEYTVIYIKKDVSCNNRDNQHLRSKNGDNKDKRAKLDTIFLNKQYKTNDGQTPLREVATVLIDQMLWAIELKKMNFSGVSLRKIKKFFEFCMINLKNFSTSIGHTSIASNTTLYEIL